MPPGGSRVSLKEKPLKIATAGGSLRNTPAKRGPRGNNSPLSNKNDLIYNGGFYSKAPIAPCRRLITAQQAVILKLFAVANARILEPIKCLTKSQVLSKGSRLNLRFLLSSTIFETAFNRRS